MCLLLIIKRPFEDLVLESEFGVLDYLFIALLLVLLLARFELSVAGGWFSVINFQGKIAERPGGLVELLVSEFFVPANWWCLI